MEQSAKDLLLSVWGETSHELARVVAAMGIDLGEIDDVLQEVYMAAWQSPPPQADSAGMRRWLFRVTINRCHLEHRRGRRWRRTLAGLGQLWARPRRGDPADAVSEAEERELVRRALDRLDPRLRSVLVLRYFEGFDSKEIGAILQMPDATVRSHLRTARNKLRWELKRAEYRHE